MGLSVSFSACLNVARESVVRSDVLMMSVSAGGSVGEITCKRLEALGSKRQVVGWLNWRSLKTSASM